MWIDIRRQYCTTVDAVVAGGGCECDQKENLFMRGTKEGTERDVCVWPRRMNGMSYEKKRKEMPAAASLRSIMLLWSWPAADRTIPIPPPAPFPCDVGRPLRLAIRGGAGGQPPAKHAEQRASGDACSGKETSESDAPGAGPDEPDGLLVSPTVQASKAAAASRPAGREWRFGHAAAGPRRWTSCSMEGTREKGKSRYGMTSISSSLVLVTVNLTISILLCCLLPLPTTTAWQQTSWQVTLLGVAALPGSAMHVAVVYDGDEMAWGLVRTYSYCVYLQANIPNPINMRVAWRRDLSRKMRSLLVGLTNTLVRCAESSLGHAWSRVRRGPRPYVSFPTLDATQFHDHDPIRHSGIACVMSISKVDRCHTGTGLHKCTQITFLLRARAHTRAQRHGPLDC